VASEQEGTAAARQEQCPLLAWATMESMEVTKFRDALLQKSWFGFDLDDTLHEFRRASHQGITATLESISSQSETPLPELKSMYDQILKDKTKAAFTDGKTSFDYRRERFTTLLAHFSIQYDEKHMAGLLDLYEDTLTTSLELKSDATALLSGLRGRGKRIVIITEGPQDAQERTVQALGLEPYIDFLATTNRFGCAKTTGLFASVMDHLEIEADDIVFIGDSWQRDMEPTMAEGILSIHLDDSKATNLGASPPAVASLSELQHILSSW
jgi:FMN phosphatase YigB (HAD superfamily)